MTSGKPPPHELEVVAGAVSQRLAAYLEDQNRSWIALDPGVAPALDAIRRLVLAGGKRLRAAFCHWGHVGAGGNPDDAIALDVASAFELLHAFALIHDDVMDGSTRRRGAPTVHVDMAAWHREQGLRGEPRRFGEGVAVLAGDLAAVLADQLVVDAPPRARAIWNQLQIEVNVGQYLDVVGTAHRDVGLEAARRISRLKSGRYTVERPLQVGAALAGAPDELITSLSAYGEPLGDAFQLRDDLLGVFGDPAATGKPVAEDIREGKPTPLLAIARQRANDGQLAVLDRVGTSTLGDGDVAAIAEVIEETGARAEIEREIDQLHQRAVDALEGLPLTAPAIAALRSLADYVANRDR